MSDGFGSVESFRGWESFVPYLFVLRRRVKLTYFIWVRDTANKFLWT